jgi:hypothetical protein
VDCAQGFRQIPRVPPERDPRFRPYRVVLWIVYFLLILVPVGTVLVEVVRHLSGPHRPAATGALPTRMTMRVCVQELEQLHREQNQRAWRLTADVGARSALASFDEWSRDWEQRVDDLSDRCRLDASVPDPQGFGGRAELARARDAVLALHRAYVAQANRFALEGAELARGAALALETAQAAVTPKP